ncbi:MAG: peptidoglycan editing factor PgeF [Patescibacteria group bacterium]|nr:peptidoglycan editing factor PgeF [Patescibacteria group bacterium]
MEEHFFKFSNLSKYPEVIHGISNRNFGDMRFGKGKDEEVIKNREQFFQKLGINLSDVVVPRLAHSSIIANVSQAEKGRGGRDTQTALMATDGLITSEKGIYLMVTIADCLPVLLYDPTLKIIGLVHAGWRGIIGQIIPKTIEKLRIVGAEPQNLVVGVGPGICQKHFVVKKDVLSLFLEYYPSATFVRNNDGYVDLKKAVLIDLKKGGVLPGNIEIANVCTACENGIYGSFRKEKDSVPAAAAVIGMRE